MSSQSPQIRPAGSAIALLLALISVSPSPVAAGTRLQPTRPQPTDDGHTPRAAVIAQAGALPLRFERNEGQEPANTKFIARLGSAKLSIGSGETVLELERIDPPAVKKQEAFRSPSITSSETDAPTPTTAERVLVRTRLEGASANSTITGEDELPGRTNYFIGRDPANWHTGVRSYSRVRSAGVYPGVDQVFYERDGVLEYDFLAAPGADLRRIRFTVEGATRTSIDPAGDLVLETPLGEVRHRAPAVYQDGPGGREWVSGQYSLDDAGTTVGFELGAYDTSRPLVIDPKLVYSTWLGGSGAEYPRVPGPATIAGDAEGNTVVTAQCYSTDYPTRNALYGSAQGNAVITKLNPSGTAIIYSTYFGGGGGESYPRIALGPSGEVFVSGTTTSADLPITPGAFQPNYLEKYDYFVAKLSADGQSLLFSTYFHAPTAVPNSEVLSESIGAIHSDGEGGVWIGGATRSSALPGANLCASITPSGATDFDAFLARLDPTGSRIADGIRFGGSGIDAIADFKIGTDGSIYAVGATTSANFPVTPGAFQRIYQGASAATYEDLFDGFAVKLRPTCGGLAYATYVGSDGRDFITGFDVNAAGEAYISGLTGGTTFPTTPGAPHPTPVGNYRHYILRLDATGTRALYSTFWLGYLDGLVLSNGRLWLEGATPVGSFAPRDPIFDWKCRGRECSDPSFIAALDPETFEPSFASLLGIGGTVTGFGVDGRGDAVVEMFEFRSETPSVPIKNPLPGTGGKLDLVVAKITLNVPPPVVASIKPSPASKPFSLKLAGSNFQPGVQVFIGADTAPWASVKAGAAKLTLKGTGLDERFPSGESVSIRIHNPDGGEAVTHFTR